MKNVFYSKWFLVLNNTHKNYSIMSAIFNKKLRLFIQEILFLNAHPVTVDSKQ